MNAETYALLEDFIENRLPDDERTAFEQRLATEPDLAAELWLMKQLRAQIGPSVANQTADQELRKTLQSIGNQYFKPEAKVVRLSSRRWFWAAAVGAAAVCAWLIFAPSRTDFYSTYAQLPTASFTEKSAEQSAEKQLLAEAEQAFNSKNYVAAEEKLTAYSVLKPDDAEARLFLGIAQLENKHGEAAKTNFDKLKTGGGVWASEATWFLAMAYLKEKNYKACQMILQQLPLGNNHEKAANELLEKLAQD